MAPVVLFETHSSSYNGTTPWTGFWNDIVNAIRHHPPRTPTRRTNKIEPQKSEVISPPPPPTTTVLLPRSPHPQQHQQHQQQQQQPDLLDSKFQVEYVSFPRLVEDEAISKEEDIATFPHDESKKVMFQQQQQQQQQNFSTSPPIQCSLGGSRRRLLGTPWMF